MSNVDTDCLQWAAVRMEVEDIKEPPQNGLELPLKTKATCHGYWFLEAGWPPTIRVAKCSSKWLLLLRPQLQLLSFSDCCPEITLLFIIKSRSVITICILCRQSESLTTTEDIYARKFCTLLHTNEVACFRGITVCLRRSSRSDMFVDEHQRCSDSFHIFCT